MLIVLLSALTACSEQANGIPTAATTSLAPTGGDPFPPASGIPTGAGSSQPGMPRSPIADVAPCSLLTAAEIAELRAGPSKEERLNNGRVCSFYEAQGFVTGVAIFDELGLADVVARGEIKPVAVGKHKAVQSIRGIDTCAISIEVTATSRVDTQGTAGGDEKKSCDIALRVARLVEPKLPS